MKMIFFTLLISWNVLAEKPTMLLNEQQMGIDTSSFINDFGDWIASSTLGVYINGKKILNADKVGRNTQAYLNNNREWVVASQSGVYLNGQRVLRNITLGTHYNLNLNNRGNWILAGNAFGAYLDGKKVLDKEKVGISVAVGINDQFWIVSSSAGVFSGNFL